MNPYASQLGNLGALEVIQETPRKLAGEVSRLGPESLERSYAPGKWPARVIVCHLADVEIAFGFRLRQALAEPHHVIQTFDQDAWAKSSELLDAHAALDTFSALRHWNVALLRAIPPESFLKPLAHPERGEMTFQVLVETMGGHDLNHLRQLESV
ncbi:MAG: DinB family protein [Bryobacteraceae bacterium]